MECEDRKTDGLYSKRTEKRKGWLDEQTDTLTIDKTDISVFIQSTALIEKIYVAYDIFNISNQSAIPIYLHSLKVAIKEPETRKFVKINAFFYKVHSCILFSVEHLKGKNERSYSIHKLSKYNYA